MELKKRGLIYGVLKNPKFNLLDELVRTIGTDEFFEIISYHSIIAERNLLEENENVLQVIPYILIRSKENPDLYLHYRRLIGGGDSRQYGKVSCGFGGHVDFDDVFLVEGGQFGSENVKATIIRTILRELQEELAISPSDYALDETGAINGEINRCVDIIYREDTPIDRVHLGLAYCIEISESLLEKIKTEEETELLGFKSLKDIEEEYQDSIETWTKVMIGKLKGN